MASVSMPDVHGNASLWLPGGLDIDDPEAELDGITKVGTYADPEATREGEHCGIETLFHFFKNCPYSSVTFSDFEPNLFKHIFFIYHNK